MVKVNYVRNENLELVTNPYILVDLIKCCDQEYHFSVLTTKKQLLQPYDSGLNKNNINDPILAVYLENTSKALNLQHCVNCGAPTEFEEITDKLQYIKDSMKELEERLRSSHNSELINNITGQLNQILLEQVKIYSKASLSFALYKSIAWFKEALDQYYHTFDRLFRIL